MPGSHPLASQPPPPIDGVAASHLQLPPGDWPTLLDALCARFPGISRDTWRQRIARGRVLDAAGAAISEDAAFRVGRDVYYYREVAQEPVVPFEETLLHVDDDLVVADKPHFLPVVPAGRFVRETLLSRLQAKLRNPALVPLHRIDRGTAGVVLFSANPGSRAHYQALFRERRIDKRYEAIAQPLPQLTFPHERQSRLVRGEPFFRMTEVPGEANSLTRIEVIETSQTDWRYALMPVTGRKHQLRVHMAALGAPIANDPFYPELQPEREDDYAKPLRLLARSLCFVDPITGRQQQFTSSRSL